MRADGILWYHVKLSRLAIELVLTMTAYKLKTYVYKQKDLQYRMEE